MIHVTDYFIKLNQIALWIVHRVCAIDWSFYHSFLTDVLTGDVSDTLTTYT